jgi:short/branched chain acyl-CoA dehydrogenase
MLNFDLTEEQQILRESVRDFAEKEIKPIAEELDEKEEFSLDLVGKMAGMGLFGMFVSEDYGGIGAGYLSYVIAVEELARVDGSANSLGIGPIFYYGSEEQKRQWLPKLCTGETLASFGLTEPNAGSDAGATQTTAELKEGEWTINGSKIFITNSASPISGVIIVQAKTGDDGNGKNELSCILVPNDEPGVTAKEMHGKMMWRSSNTGELYFEDVRVPEKNLLGEKGTGFRQMLATLDRGRLAIGAMGLGGAQGAFELALRYSRERKQFGRTIGSFQINAFKMADMAMEIEAARNLLYKACWLCDEGRPFTMEAAMAKLYCSEVMRRVVNEAVQIHGGYGLMREYQVERFFRDQKLLEIGEGTSEIQRIVIARKLGCFE